MMNRKHKGSSLIEIMGCIVIISIMSIGLISMFGITVKIEQNMEQMQEYYSITSLKTDLLHYINNSENLFSTDKKITIQVDDTIINYELFDNYLYCEDEKILAVKNGHFEQFNNIVSIYLETENSTLNLEVHYE